MEDSWSEEWSEACRENAITVIDLLDDPDECDGELWMDIMGYYETCFIIYYCQGCEIPAAENEGE